MQLYSSHSIIIPLQAVCMLFGLHHYFSASAPEHKEWMRLPTAAYLKAFVKCMKWSMGWMGWWAVLTVPTPSGRTVPSKRILDWSRIEMVEVEHGAQKPEIDLPTPITIRYKALTT
jgi:hypothetical protein